MNKILNKNIFFFLILLLGIFLRIDSLNFDNLWYDEIISFWVASPEHSLLQSYNLHKNIEIAPFTFNLILKYFYELVGYDVSYARILPGLFSILAIIVVFYISKEINNDNSFLLSTFLIAFNIFLISYAQEQRVYSLLIFFSLTSILFFLKSLKINPKNYDLFLFFIFSLILISLHLFSVFILFSFIIFLFLRFCVIKEIFIKLKSVLILLLLIGSIFYVPYVLSFSENLNSNLDINYSWNKKTSLKFFTNFYFSNFFGSRLLGLIFLISLVALTITKRNFVSKLEKPLLILIIILVSYSIPLTFGFLFHPILLPRYIIYIPALVIILISNLSFKIENLKARYFVISVLAIFTFGNMFTERPFKQFIKDKVPGKPRYVEAIKFISTSGNNDYSLKIENMWSDKDTKNAINNYIDHLSKKIEIKINYVSLDKISEKPTWILCPTDINKKNCPLPDQVRNFKILKEENFNSINLKLIK